jgi:hypothetical protein
MNGISTLARMENAVRRLRESGAGDRDVFGFCLSCFEKTPCHLGKDCPEESGFVKSAFLQADVSCWLQRKLVCSSIRCRREGRCLIFCIFWL